MAAIATIEAFSVHPAVSVRTTIMKHNSRSPTCTTTTNGGCNYNCKKYSSSNHHHLNMANEDGVVELVDDDDDDDDEEEEKKPTKAPIKVTPTPLFLSQGEITDEDLQEALNPDLSDPKQTRVIIYIILSLVPVLFLIPLMLGSRDLIPLDALPPVSM